MRMIVWRGPAVNVHCKPRWGPTFLHISQVLSLSGVKASICEYKHPHKNVAGDLTQNPEPSESETGVLP